MFQSVRCGRGPALDGPGSDKTRFRAVKSFTLLYALTPSKTALPTALTQGLRRVACGPGATTTLEPTFAFKRAVYDA